MDEFRFGELRERSLHRQLKALYCPDDGVAEHPVGGSIADLWSPNQGIIEIQTGSLGKLKPKLATYLAAGHRVTVVHPVAERRTVVTWNADRTEELRRRRSPLRGRVETSFREIGALAEFLLRPGFILVVALTDEEDHRAEDGQGSWRRQGRSKVDRVLKAVVGERKMTAWADYAALVPPTWAEPGTTKTLAEALDLKPGEVQALVSCLKKLGVLEVCGREGRAHLLRRVTESTDCPG